MTSRDDLLRALPMRGLRADAGTKASPRGGAKAIVDLEPAAEFEIVNAVPDEILARWSPHDDPEHLLMCLDNVAIGVRDELRTRLGPELPAMRVVVREVLPHPVEANEMNNQYVGRKVIEEACRRLA